jgi:ABC-type lipoprotein export system ATPase subunit
MPVVQAISLTKTYGSRFGGTAIHALSGITLELERGEFTALMGPSASGKTTLLSLLGLIDRPNSGAVLVDGFDTAQLRGDSLADFRRKTIGFVFQDSTLLDTLTLRENIALPLALGGMKSTEIAARIAAVAEELGIDDALDRYAFEVSGGQKQRAAAARAVIGEPAIILADEPTGALDSRAGRGLLESLAALNSRRGTTVLMATHDPFCASSARRVLFLRDGMLFAELRSGQDRRSFFERIIAMQASMDGRLL